MMLHAMETGSSGPRHSDQAAFRPNSPQSPLGTVKEIVVTVAAPYERRTLETTLTELAGQTAFDLIELRQSPDGLLGQWHARFRLRAPRGVVGDAQIYTLLRCFAGELRWVQISKEPAREIPAHLGPHIWPG